MSEPIVIHQRFEYQKNVPFHIYNVEVSDHMISEILPHWHEELELVYIYSRDEHYIDGHHISGGPGDLIITNSNAVRITGSTFSATKRRRRRKPSSPS